MAHRLCVSSHGHTAHQTVTAFVTLHTAAEESVYAWKVNTHTRPLCCCADIKPIFQPEVSVKRVLFCESWRCRAGSPPPLLNLQVRTFSCTMVRREQTLPVSRALFCAVCRVKQLQNAVQRVNGSQSDKRQAVMLYRVCFHTYSQKAGWIDCSCLTAQQTDRPVAVTAAVERTGRPK